MKNFKKVLALVLVVATLLSFATVASAKVPTDAFTDKKDIKADYSTAVDVLTYLGVLAGYPNKTFRPQGEITRAEAAKIIAMLDNGSSEINGLYASANPFTDSKGHWAESFIAYCYKTGIIDGIGNLKFAPDAKVTGVQFLKMTLIVLGYDAKKEGLTGASWAVNTLALAKKAGLLAGLGYKYDYSANLTREAAAQIMLNALNSQIVDYGYEFKPGEKQVFVTVAGAVVVNGVYLRGQWNVKSVPFTDAFERPGNKYIDTKTGATITSRLLTPVLTYKTKVSECKLLEDLGIPKSDTKTTVYADFYKNGAMYNTTVDSVYTNLNDYSLYHESSNRCTALPVANSHQGTLTEVYDVSGWAGAGDVYDEDKNDDGVVKSGEDYRIVSVDTYLANVEDYKANTTNRVGHHVTGTPLVTVRAYVPETRVDNDNTHNDKNQDPACNGKNALDDVWTYETTETFAKNDKVLVTYSYKLTENGNQDTDFYGVQSVEKAKVENAQLTGFDHTKDCDSRVVGVAGTNKNEAFLFEFGYNLLAKDNVGATKAFYYDKYDNVIGMSEPVNGTTSYAVLDKTYYLIESGAGSANGTMVDLDAKSTDVKVASASAVLEYNADGVLGLTANKQPAAHSYTTFSRYANMSIRSEAWNGNAPTTTVTINGVEVTFVQGNEWAYDQLYTVSTDAYGRYVYTFANGDYFYNLHVTITDGDKNVYVDVNEDGKFVAADDYAAALNADTKVLIHENDGTYTAATIATVGSLQAGGLHVVDTNADGYADIVYLFNGIIRKGDVSVGYVADWSNPEYKLIGSTTYYVYNVYFDGVRTPVYFDEIMDNLEGKEGLYKFSFTSGEEHILYAKATLLKNANGVYGGPEEADVWFVSLNADKTSMKVAKDAELTQIDEVAKNFADGIKVYYVDGNTVAHTEFDLVDASTLESIWTGDQIVYSVNAAGKVTAIYIITDADIAYDFYPNP